MPDLARICREHNLTCEEDTQRDVVTCPGGGGHRVRSGQWFTSGGGAGQSASGDSLVQQHARQAFLKAKKDRAVARVALMREAEINVHLRNALLMPYLHEAAAAAISRVAGVAPEEEQLAPRDTAPVRRTTAQASPRTPRSNADRGLQLVGEFNLRNLLAFRLPSGSELSDATREQVLDAAEAFFSKARHGAMRGRWLRLVAELMENDVDRVRQVVSERQLGILYGKAETDIHSLGHALRARAAVTGPAERLAGARS